MEQTQTQTLDQDKLKDYKTLRFEHHMLGEDVKSVLQPNGQNKDTIMNKRKNDEDDELIYILVGQMIKDGGILTSDMEYRELNFSLDGVNVTLVGKKSGVTKHVNITEIFTDVVTNLGFEYKVMDFGVLEA